MKKFYLTSLILLLFYQTTVFCQTTFSFQHNGINRTYILFVPENNVKGEAMPLLLALHGFTQNGQTMMQLSGFNDLASEYNFVVAYPYGVGTSWNVGVTGGSTADDVGFLSVLIDSIAMKTTIDQNRVYATGFSNGGFMSYRLACEASTRIAAIASVAGTMAVATANACFAERAVPVMHIHGTSDFIVPYNGNGSFQSVNATMEYWNTQNGCPSDPTLFTYPDIVSEGSTVEASVWDSCNNETENRLLRIINGGHTWPGNSGSGGIGITNMDISASAEIWTFLSRFSLSSPVGITTFHGKQPFTVTPNPYSSGLLSLFCDATEATLKIVDIHGRLRVSRQINFSNGKAFYNPEPLEKGLYLLVLSTGKTQSSTKLIVW